jgi:hypothetical protein
MAILCMLWVGLVLLGVVQTQAQGQDSVQPNFQQDKVRVPCPMPKAVTGALGIGTFRTRSSPREEGAKSHRAFAGQRPEPAEQEGGLGSCPRRLTMKGPP